MKYLNLLILFLVFSSELSSQKCVWFGSEYHNHSIYDMVNLPNGDTFLLMTGDQLTRYHFGGTNILRIIGCDGTIKEERNFKIDSLKYFTGFQAEYDSIDNNIIVSGVAYDGNGSDFQDYTVLARLDVGLNIVNIKIEKTSSYGNIFHQVFKILDDDIYILDVASESSQYVTVENGYQGFYHFDKNFNLLDSFQFYRDVNQGEFFSFDFNYNEKRELFDLFAVGGNIYELNILNKEIIKLSYPYTNYTTFTNSMTVKKFGDNIIAGVIFVNINNGQIPENFDSTIVVYTMDSDYNVLNYNGIGDFEFQSFPLRNLDFKNNNEVFLGLLGFTDPTNPFPYFEIGKFDRDLNLTWQIAYGNDGKHYFVNGIEACYDGGCFVYGVTFDTRIPFYIKFDADGKVSSTYNINKDDLWSLKCFPNPSPGIFRLEAEGMIGYDLIIQDIKGSQIYHAIIGSNGKAEADLSYLPAGLYPYTITHEGRVVYSGKWVKE
ncbi:MAG: hypothetical protein KDC16_11985 [Saprospiraceae bacterium]|nr:hypothetical protein [Saprospiraceae bacterium]